MFSNHISNPLHIVLHGRSKVALEKVRENILFIRSDLETRCDMAVADLTDTSLLEVLSEQLFPIESSLNYSKLIFFDNAGSLGPLTCIGSTDRLNDFLEAFNLNITSSCFLTS